MPFEEIRAPATRQEGRTYEETKTESTPPLYASRQAGSLVQMFERISARSQSDTLEDGCQNLVQA